MLAYLWRFLHLVFAFSFVGAITIAEWNGRQARVTSDWSRRAALWGVVRQTTRVLGLGALVLLGLLGNLLGVAMGLPMGGRWMALVNGLWLVGIALYLFVALPTVGRLVTLSDKALAAPADGTPAGYDATLARWRLAYVLLGILYVAMLVLMVLRPLLG